MHLTGKTKGFTLIELMIAMTLSSIVIAAGFALFITSNRSHHSTTQTSLLQEAARSSLDIMANDILMAGFGTVDMAEVEGADDPESEMVFSTNTVDSSTGADRLQFQASLGALTMVIEDTTRTQVMQSCGSGPTCGMHLHYYIDDDPGQGIAENPLGHDRFESGMLIDLLNLSRQRLGRGKIGNIDSLAPNVLMFDDAGWEWFSPQGAGSNVPAGAIIVQRPVFITYQLEGDGTLLRCVRLSKNDPCSKTAGDYDSLLNKPPLAGDPETIFALSKDVADIQFSYLLEDEDHFRPQTAGDALTFSATTQENRAIRNNVRAVKIELLMKSKELNPAILQNDCDNNLVKTTYYIGNRVHVVACGYSYLQVSTVVQLPNMYSYSVTSDES